MLKLNKASINNLTDEELIKFCDFKKSDNELDGYEYLINNLCNRLSTKINSEHEEITELKDSIEELDGIIQDLKNERDDLEQQLINVT